jgi:hypothetical protein
MFLWCCIATHAVLHIMASDNRRTDVEEVLCYCVLGVVFGAFIVAAAVLAHLLSITPNGHSMRFDYGGYHFCVVVPCINLLCFWHLLPVGGLRIYGKMGSGVSVYHVELAGPASPS